MLAVVGSSDPSRSVEALERLKQVESIYSIDCATSTNASKGLWTWELAAKETYNLTPVSAVGKAGLSVGDPVLSGVAASAMFGLRSAGNQPNSRISDTST